MIIDAVVHQHASPNTVLHLLYIYYYKNIAKVRLAELFHKDPSTVANWIKRYEETGAVDRKSKCGISRFSEAQKRWLIQYFHIKPLSFLDEVKYAFEREFHQTIAISTVWQTIHDFGMTWKVLERRAIQVKENDILRFVMELCQLLIGVT
ncbi:unnamed protein product [Aphanomyces euteiches]|nr:hypothetical protein AeRB84_017549 [Aphanomyces euteiches]